MNYHSPVSSPRQSSRKHRRFVSSPARFSTDPQPSESNSFDSHPKRDRKENTTFLRKSSSRFGSNKVFITAWKEARGVWIWSVASCAFQLFCFFLVSTNTINDQNDSPTEETNYWMNSQIIQVLTGNILSLFPKKVSTNQAPGFVYSSPWILLIIRKYYGVFCNIPIRTSEMVLGRLTPREMAAIIPIHFAGAWLSSFLLKIIFFLLGRKSQSQCYTNPIEYSLKNSWVVDLWNEISVSCLFVLFILIIPELLKLNRLPNIWLPGLLSYPLYRYSVDSTGIGSVFAPNVIHAFRCDGEIPLEQYPHVVGPIIGGLIGGKIMSIYFPDPAPLNNDHNVY